MKVFLFGMCLSLASCGLESSMVLGLHGSWGDLVFMIRENGRGEYKYGMGEGSICREISDITTVFRSGELVFSSDEMKVLSNYFVSESFLALSYIRADEIYDGIMFYFSNDGKQRVFHLPNQVELPDRKMVNEFYSILHLLVDWDPVLKEKIGGLFPLK